MRFNRSIYLVFFGIFIILWGVSGAGAEDLEPNWGIGFRGGFSSFMKEISSANQLEGEIGGVFNAVAVYELTDSISFGLEVDWESHKLSRGTLGYGKTSSFSLLLPFEFHIAKTKKVSPYAFLSCGYTYNIFRESASFKTIFGAMAHIELDNSFIIKSGLGIDMFLLSETFAINLEAGMSYSIGRMHIIGETVSGDDDFYNYVMFFVVGVRYYFPESSFP